MDLATYFLANKHQPDEFCTVSVEHTTRIETSECIEFKYRVSRNSDLTDAVQIRIMYKPPNGETDQELNDIEIINRLKNSNTYLGFGMTGRKELDVDFRYLLDVFSKRITITANETHTEYLIVINVKLTELFIGMFIPLIWLQNNVIVLMLQTEDTNISDVNFLFNWKYLNKPKRKKLACDSFCISAQCYLPMKYKRVFSDSTIEKEREHPQIEEARMYKTFYASKVPKSKLVDCKSKGMMLIFQGTDVNIRELMSKISLRFHSCESRIDNDIVMKIDKYMENISFTYVNTSNNCLYIPFNTKDLDSFRVINKKGFDNAITDIAYIYAEIEFTKPIANEIHIQMYHLCEFEYQCLRKYGDVSWQKPPINREIIDGIYHETQ